MRINSSNSECRRLVDRKLRQESILITLFLRENYGLFLHLSHTHTEISSVVRSSLVLAFSQWHFFDYFKYFYKYTLFFTGGETRQSQCSPGHPGTHSIDRASRTVRDMPASITQVLELNGKDTMLGNIPYILFS